MPEKEIATPPVEEAPAEPSVETLTALVAEGDLPPSLLTVTDPPKTRSGKVKADAEPEVVQARPLTEYERLVALAREASAGTILEDDPAKPFTIGVWGPEGRKLPNLCCRECQFRILANRTGGIARQFMDHWKAKHEADEDEPLTGNSGLVDKSGRPL